MRVASPMRPNVLGELFEEESEMRSRKLEIVLTALALAVGGAALVTAAMEGVAVQVCACLPL